MKLGREDTEKTLNEVFKPVVTPLQKLVDQASHDGIPRRAKRYKKRKVPDSSASRKRVVETDDSNIPIKIQRMKEMYDSNIPRRPPSESELNRNVHTPSSFTMETKNIDDEDDSDSVEDEDMHNLSQEYMQLFDTPDGDKKLGLRTGVRKYKGLLEILFKKEPNVEKITDDDKRAFTKIVKMTHLDSYKMSVGVFGRQLNAPGAAPRNIQGPPGRGFKLTADGQFDMKNKRLCNVAEAVEDNDVVSMKVVKRLIEDLRINLLQKHMTQNLEAIRTLDERVKTLESSGKTEKFKAEKEALVEELHRPARRNYPRRRIDIRGLNETWQADLVDMSAYAKENDGYKFLLTIIDIFSKFAWAVPIKSKSGLDVTKAMESVLNQGRVPQKLHVDQGKEFYNKEFKNLMQKFDIKMYSTFSNLKASICERFNRTLKERMWKKFSLQGSYRWFDILPDIISSYNDTKHRTIHMKPKDVNETNQKFLRHQVYGKFLNNRVKEAKFKINDKVRISKYKHVFEKGYTPNWTTKIFKIIRVRRTEPTTYKLIDYQDNPIEGSFYEEELSKVKHPDVYLIEKVIKKRGNKLYVKWLGFDDSHNSWINESDV
ncbi:uncharacterized protein LOC107046604 [Diachasma alloeum]|uniref:uncharacterized protein LOC107046604 n=1 Tax=Diachasma alloeum TaxID=454923 RepID=UPI00073821CC|nr:uncharacterized protein LOC107046604 [Diachasma alloeum]